MYKTDYNRFFGFMANFQPSQLNKMSVDNNQTIALSLVIEQIFYYNKYMRWIKQLWHWINPADRTQLLVLELDSVNSEYLAQLAANTQTSQAKVAQDLLKTALVDRQVAETHLVRWRALTPRQQQAAALACLNFTNRQIAAKLGISPQTVKAHIRNLLHRFDLHSKAELRQALADWDFSEWI